MTYTVDTVQTVRHKATKLISALEQYGSNSAMLADTDLQQLGKDLSAALSAIIEYYPNTGIGALLTNGWSVNIRKTDSTAYGVTGAVQIVNGAATGFTIPTTSALVSQGGTLQVTSAAGSAVGAPAALAVSANVVTCTLASNVGYLINSAARSGITITGTVTGSAQTVTPTITNGVITALALS